MIEIGKKLQKRRRELKLSYADVSKMTKLSVPHLKAIENGDLDYFKNDLTYVRFYVRSYCKAVDIPYENFKDDVSDSVEEYTNTLTLKVKEDHEKTEQSIHEKTQGNSKVQNLIKDNKGPRLAKKDRTSIQQNVQQTSRFRKKKKVDIPFLSLIAVIVIIVGILIYVGVNSLLNKDSDSSPSEEPKVTTKTPTPEKDTSTDDEKKTDDTKTTPKLAFTKDSTTAYSVSNLKDGDAIKIEITFKDRCWFDGTLNGGAIPNATTNTTFEPGQTFTYDGSAKTNDVYSFVFGFFPGTTIKVNGEEVPLDGTLANAAGVQTITLTLKGV